MASPLSRSSEYSTTLLNTPGCRRMLSGSAPVIQGWPLSKSTRLPLPIIFAECCPQKSPYGSPMMVSGGISPLSIHSWSLKLDRPSLQTTSPVVPSIINTLEHPRNEPRKFPSTSSTELIWA